MTPRLLRYALFATLSLIWACTADTSGCKRPTPEYSYSTPCTGNIAHDLLSTKPEDVRAAFLGRVVSSSGDPGGNHLGEFRFGITHVPITISVVFIRR